MNRQPGGFFTCADSALSVAQYSRTPSLTMLLIGSASKAEAAQKRPTWKKPLQIRLFFRGKEMQAAGNRFFVDQPGVFLPDLSTIHRVFHVCQEIFLK
jgi:hypothetical protein